MNCFTRWDEPHRSPDWRDQIALRLASEGRLASPRLFDRETIAQRRFYRKLTNCQNEREMSVLREKLSCDLEAYRVSQNIELRNIVECFVLADENPYRIAHAIGSAPHLVSRYEAVYFDIRSRLGNAPWIISVVVPESHTDDEEKSALYSAWRFVAYIVGVTAIEDLILSGKQPGQWERSPEMLERRAKSLAIFSAASRALAAGSCDASKASAELISLSKQIAQDAPDSNVPQTKQDRDIYRVIEMASEACGSCDEPFLAEF